MDNLKDLFAPLTINNVELKNRIVMAPMGTGLCAKDGSVTQRLIDYYAERAKGGVGLILSELAIVDHPLAGFGSVLSTHHDSFIPGLSKLTEVVHSHGAKMALQLGHVGRYRFSWESSVQPVAPSAIASRLPAPAPRALTIKEVEYIIDKFAEAAGRAQQAGFDGVEVLAGQGYLISTFLSPCTNKRTDRFGGDTPEARATFLVEIIRRIRQRVGNNFIVGCKLSVAEFIPGGGTIEDTKAIVPLLEEAGTSILHAWAAWHESSEPTTIAAVPRGAFVYLAEALKEVASIPVAAVCRINDPGLAAQIIAEKRADLVAMGRALMADPYLPQKAAECQLDDIRRCIACNQCLDARFISFMAQSESEERISCTVNAEIGRESEGKTRPTDAPAKKVLIVGGGPAGMEAARVATIRGHKVTLWEAKERLGGALIPASIPPHKEEISNLSAYLSHQMQKLGVNVQLNKEATPEAILAENAEEVILACGGQPIVPGIPGVEGKNVVTAINVLTGKDEVGEKVVIIGGGMIGCETAELLASKGKKVTVVEILPRIATDLGITSRRPLINRIRSAGVEILTSANTRNITESGVTIEVAGETQTIEADSVVLSVGTHPSRNLSESLQDKLPKLHLIGDSSEPHRIFEAIHDGWQVGCEI